MTFKYPAFLRYGGPAFIFLCEIAFRVMLPNVEVPDFYSEEGPIELLQAALAVLSFFIAIYLFAKLENPWLRVWVALAAVGSFYIAGEELSWGQWLFHWKTPAEWAHVNDQDETNLHNTSTWLDQKPRALLEIGILVGGLIIPALRKWRPAKLPEKFAVLYPSNIVVFTAVCAAIVKVLNAAGNHLHHHIFYRGSETMEFLLYYFVLLYLIDFWVRVVRKPPAVPQV